MVIGTLCNLIYLSCSQIPDRRPNIIYILADDMGYGDVSCLNPDSKIQTPNLDKLASQGITFTDAHSNSSVCTPTRYGILTGRYCWRTRLKSAVLWPWDGPLIEPDRLTVGDLLQKHGYSTACIGKWHLGWEWSAKDGTSISDSLPPGKWDPKLRNRTGNRVDFSAEISEGPLTRGFDYYYGDDVPNFPPYSFIENNRLLDIPTIQKPDTMHGNPGAMVKGWSMKNVMPSITQKAVAYIRSENSIFKRDPQKPFFLYFPLTAPHTPIAPDDQFKGQSKAGAYGDFVQEVDWTVGQIMQALDAEGLAENTLLIFTSDNGSPGRDGTNMAGPINSVRQYEHNPSYTFRGIKADIWEGGHRVPFIVRWPGKIDPGTKSDEIICHTDFMATIASIIGESLPINSAEDSYNILPVLLGESLENPIREATVHHSIDGSFAIRKGEWKLIECAGSGGWTIPNNQQALQAGHPQIQLYNIKKDAEETDNLYNEHPEAMEHLSQLLKQYRDGNRSAP